MPTEALISTPTSQAPLMVTQVFLAIQLMYLLGAYITLRGYSYRWFPVAVSHFLRFWSFWAVSAVGIAYVLGIEYAALATLLAGVILISSLSPILAIAAFISVFLLRPWELVLRQPETMAYVPKILAAVCVCTCIFHMIQKYNKRFTWNTPLSLFIGLLAVLFLSAIFSGDIKGGLDYLFKHFYPVVVITFLITNMVEDETSLNIIGTSIAISVVGVIATAFADTYFGVFNTAYEYRLHTSTFWGNPNDLGALVLIALPFVVFPWIIRAKNLEQLSIGAAMSTVLLAGLLATQSRGALLGLFLAIFTYVLVGRGKRFIMLVSVSLFVAGALAFVVVNRGADDRETSDISRITYAIAGFNMLKANPIFGVGIGNYPEQYNNYSPEFYEWGERNAHSSWILVMAEAGALGLIFFVLLFIFTWQRAWRLRSSFPEYITALVGYGIAMSLLSHSYTFPPYLLVAIIIAAQRAHAIGAKETFGLKKTSSSPTLTFQSQGVLAAP